MPRPSFFMRQVCTITLATVTQESTGAPESTAGATYTCPCTLQPVQSGVGFSVHRMQSTSGFDLYLDLASNAVSGGASVTTASLVGASNVTYTVDGVAYEANGLGMNPCSYNGTIKVNVERVA